MGVGVKDQADGGMGDLIALSLDGNEAKKVESEQQLSLSQALTDLNFAEVLSNVLEDKMEQATLEPENYINSPTRECSQWVRDGGFFRICAWKNNKVQV